MKLEDQEFELSPEFEAQLFAKADVFLARRREQRARMPVYKKALAWRAPRSVLDRLEKLQDHSLGWLQPLLPVGVAAAALMLIFMQNRPKIYMHIPRFAELPEFSKTNSAPEIYDAERLNEKNEERNAENAHQLETL